MLGQLSKASGSAYMLRVGHLVVHGDQIWGVKEVERRPAPSRQPSSCPPGISVTNWPGRADRPVLFQLKQKWQVSLAALPMRARTLAA
jgi:hypothetical protein